MYYIYVSLMIIGELFLMGVIMAIWGFKSKHPRVVLAVLCLCSIILTVALVRILKL